MYQFNEYFYRKAINLWSLAEKKVRCPFFVFVLFVFFCFLFSEAIFGNLILVSIFFSLPNDHMWGNEHSDHFTNEVKMCRYLNKTKKIEAFSWNERMFLGAKLIFLKITPSNARNSLKDEELYGLRSKQTFRQNKHSVSRSEKLRLFSHLIQIIG